MIRPAFFVRLSLALAFALLAATEPGSAQQTTRLQLPDASGLQGRRYVLDMNHAITIDAHGDVHSGQRTARVALRFVNARAEAGGRIRASVQLDSVRGAVETPHGREVVDGRHLMGTSFDVTYARTGGATYAGAVPTLDFASFGGSLPIPALLDYAFPQLPARAIRVGESWEHTWTRTQIDGGAATTRSVVSRFTVASLQRQGAATVARVNISTRSARGAVEGAFDSNGFFVIGVEDGVVREVSIEESVSGAWDFGGEQLPYKQTSRVTVSLAGAQR